MTDDQINKGLTAFDDGSSTWADCFWARVFGEELSGKRGKDRYGKVYSSTLGIEWWIANQLGLESNIPVRIVYQLFDNVNTWMTRDDLAAFIRAARLEGDCDPMVLQLINSAADAKVFEQEPKILCSVG
jgi:hypothetical protein